jgi:hypothetical protein
MLARREDDRLSSQMADAVAILGRFEPPAVELLSELLEDSRSPFAIRVAALGQLRALGPRARFALGTLDRMLWSSDAVVEITEPIGDAIRVAERAQFRLRIADAILSIDPEGGPARVAPFLLWLAKRSPQERFWGIDLLGRCGSQARSSVPPLVATLASDHHIYGGSIDHITPLLGSEHRRLLPAILELTRPSDVEIRAEILLRLGYRREAIQHAARGLKHPYAHVRIAAAVWLGKLGREARSVAPLLRKAHPDAVAGERARWTMTLWQVQGVKDASLRRALAALDNLLMLNQGADPSIGYISMMPFWWGQAPDSVLEEGDVLDAAIFTILRRLQASSDSVAVLSRALRDKSPQVRLVAAVALARAQRDHRDTVPALCKVLKHHPWLFRYAADAVAALGPRAEPLAPWLQALLKHPDPDVSGAADRVLRRIGPGLAAKGWWTAGSLRELPTNSTQLLEDLSGKDALRADLAVWRLAADRPRAISLLRKHLRPPPTLNPKRLAQLIKDLDHDEYTKRERASRELAQAIESAAPTLRRVGAANPSLEVRLRIDQLLEALDRPTTAERRLRLRALSLLEEMGGPDAKALVERLAQGGLPAREAAAVLNRLDRR